MQHAHDHSTARADARAIAVPATSSNEVALLFGAIGALLLALLVLLL